MYRVFGLLDFLRWQTIIQKDHEHWRLSPVKTIRFFGIFGVVLLSCFAQQPTATLFGRITDITGAVMPNAAVEISNAETGVKWQVKTNGSGYYTQPLLPPGNYQVTATLEGFRPVTRAITLAVDQVARSVSRLRLAR